MNLLNHVYSLLFLLSHNLSVAIYGELPVLDLDLAPNPDTVVIPMLDNFLSIPLHL